MYIFIFYHFIILFKYFFAFSTREEREELTWLLPTFVQFSNCSHTTNKPTYSDLLVINSIKSVSSLKGRVLEVTAWDGESRVLKSTVDFLIEFLSKEWLGHFTCFPVISQGCCKNWSFHFGISGEGEGYEFAKWLYGGCCNLQEPWKTKSLTMIFPSLFFHIV